MKNINLRLSQKGFTLIELLLVMGIIGLISAVGISTFIGFSKSNALSQATADFVNALNTAKSKAYSQAQSPSCSVGIQGYRIKITLPRTYVLSTKCSGLDVDLKTTVISDTGISFDNTSVSDIFFQVISGGVVGNGNIKITGYGVTNTINVSSTGVINVQ